MDNFIFAILLKKKQNYLKNQLNQGCTADVMHLFDEMMRQVNPFGESDKRTCETKLNI
jgi:hypothetical protein